MNIENIKKAIAVMERAKAHDSVNMSYWQSNAYGRRLDRCRLTEEEFHACGNRACFAGHIAISPEFQADGGACTCDGSPVLLDSVDEDAVAHWLGTGNECAQHLVHGGAFYGDSAIYPVPFADVQAEHVITALKQLLELGEEKCLKLWNDHEEEEE